MTETGQRHYEREYYCKQCGYFNVIHSNKRNRNKTCACGRPVEYIRLAAVFVAPVKKSS